MAEPMAGTERASASAESLARASASSGALHGAHARLRADERHLAQADEQAAGEDARHGLDGLLQRLGVLDALELGVHDEVAVVGAEGPAVGALAHLRRGAELL